MTPKELVGAVTAVYLALIDAVVVGPNDTQTIRQYCLVNALRHLKGTGTSLAVVEEVIALIDFPELARLIERTR